MGVLDAIAGIGKAVWAFLGFQSQRETELNKPEMKANAAAGTAVKQADAAAADVTAGQAGDLDQLRKDAAE